MIAIGSRIDEEAKPGIAGRSTVQWLQQNGQCTIVKNIVYSEEEEEEEQNTHTQEKRTTYIWRGYDHMYMTQGFQ